LGHRREVADRGLDHASAPLPATALEAVRSVPLRRARASRTEPALGPEVPLARNVVHLDADPVRALEEDGIVGAREMRRILGRVDDPRAELVDEETINRIDGLPLAGPETPVGGARAALVGGRA